MEGEGGEGEEVTQIEQLIKLFRENGNRLTLGQILNTTLAAEYRARMTDIRNSQRYEIKFQRGKCPSENLYTLIPRQEYQFDQAGQGMLLA